MLSLLCGVNFNETSKVDDCFTRTKSYTNLLHNNHLENICEHSSFFNTFIAYLKDLNLPDDNNNKETIELIRAFVKNSIKNDDDNNELISLAISCLQMFVKINWLGPTPIELANIPSLLARKDSAKELSLNERIFNLREHFQDDDKKVKILS